MWLFTRFMSRSGSALKSRLKNLACTFLPWNPSQSPRHPSNSLDRISTVIFKLCACPEVETQLQSWHPISINKLPSRISAAFPVIPPCAVTITAALENKSNWSLMGTAFQGFPSVKNLISKSGYCDLNLEWNSSALSHFLLFVSSQLQSLKFSWWRLDPLFFLSLITLTLQYIEWLYGCEVRQTLR